MAGGAARHGPGAAGAVHLRQPGPADGPRAASPSGPAPPASTASWSSTCRPKRPTRRTPCSQRHGLDTIFLLSPTTTSARIRRAAELGGGFLYGISRVGVTGARDDVADSARAAGRSRSRRNRSAAGARVRVLPARARARGRAVGRRRGGGIGPRAGGGRARPVGGSGKSKWRTTCDGCGAERRGPARRDRPDRRGDRPSARPPRPLCVCDRARQVRAAPADLRAGARGRGARSTSARSTRRWEGRSTATPSGGSTSG